MICYLDRTFCVSPDCKCGRKLTPEIEAAAQVWWNEGKPKEEWTGAPIAMSCFCGGTLDEVLRGGKEDEST